MTSDLPISRLNPGLAGEVQTGFYSRWCRLHRNRFCERTGLLPGLYSPKRLAERSEMTIEEALPRGWELVLDYLTEDMTRKRPIYNRAAMRRLCVDLRVPYWDKMRVNEMRAIIVLWAMAYDRPETT